MSVNIAVKLFSLSRVPIGKQFSFLHGRCKAILNKGFSQKRTMMQTENPDTQEPEAPQDGAIQKGTKKENPLLNFGFNLIIPTIIMMKFSTDEYLGQVYGLVTALAFPLLYGLYDLLGAGKVNVFFYIRSFEYHPYWWNWPHEAR
jgi:hypothetical protein